MSIALRLLVPVTVARDRYDDVLFVRLAGQLQRGHWLGPFDQLTLLKGPAYPAFVALLNRSGLQLKLGEQLIHLLAALTIAGCVWVSLRRPIAATLVFVVIALDPASFSDLNSLVRRDGWYASLSLFLIGAAFLALWAAMRPLLLRWAIVAAVCTGFLGATYWLGREEGPWILPALLLPAVALPLLALLRRRRSIATESEHDLEHSTMSSSAVGLRLTAVLAALVVSAGLPLWFVLHQNAAHYGSAMVNDVSTGNFATAYADWSRVHVGPQVKYLPINAAQRAAVYAVSPAARELRDNLENPRNVWLTASELSCADRRLCGDYVSWLEAFAVRDAAAAAGHFTSEAAAQHFFGELAGQIEAACDQRRLSCSPAPPGILKQFSGTSVASVAADFWTGTRYVLTTESMTKPMAARSAPPRAQRIPPAIRHLFLTTVRGVAPSDAAYERARNRFAAHAWPYALLFRGYQLLLPLLALTGLLGMLAGWIFGGPRRRSMTILVSTVGLAAVARLGAISVVAVTQLPDASTRSTYQLTARLLLLAFGLLGSAQLADVLASKPWVRGDGPVRARLSR